MISLYETISIFAFMTPEARIILCCRHVMGCNIEIQTHAKGISVLFLEYKNMYSLKHP